MNDKKNREEDLFCEMFAAYDDILTVEEVAEMLRIDKKRAYRMVRAGEIKSIHHDRFIRVAKPWVIEYVRQCGVRSGEKKHRERRAAVTLFCQTPKSRKQIQEFLDLADRKFFRDSVLHPLLEEGVLRMTIPDAPTNVNQKYVATQKIDREKE